MLWRGLTACRVVHALIRTGKGRFSVRIDEKLDLVLKKGCFPVPNAEDPAMCCWERCQCVLGGGFRQKVPVCGLAKCR